MKQLEIEPKKTTAEFHANYTLHDKAGDIFKNYMRQRHVKVIDYGEDRRNERVWAKGKDRPDAIIYHPSLQLAFVDWKGHNGAIWMLNKRAYESYVKHSELYQIPVFCIWVLVNSSDIYFARLPLESFSIDRMPHDANVVIKASPSSIRHIDNLLKEITLYKQIEFTFKD